MKWSFPLALFPYCQQCTISSFSILLSIPHSKPLHRRLNQHYEWKIQTLGPEKSHYISFQYVGPVYLLTVHFLRKAKRQKCTFLKFFSLFWKAPMDTA